MEILPQTWTTHPPTVLRNLVLVFLIVGVVLFGISIREGSWSGGRAPLPFAFLDVAVVHVLCCIPLAVVAAAYFHRRLPPVVAVLFGGLLLLASAVPFWSPFQWEMPTWFRLSPLVPPLLRISLAFGPALAVALCCFGLRNRPRGQGERATALVVGFVVGMLVWVLPPWVYVSARCQHDLSRLSDFAEQSRFGEARALAHELLMLSPTKTWNDHPMPEVVAELDRMADELEARVRTPLTESATAEERLEHARSLAILGRTEEALAALSGVTSPDADNLRGTIHEARGDWASGLVCYQSAREGGSLAALRGVAYCQRKLGRYTEAEATYLQVLKLAPTAETHFLLAQFYEDTQQSAEAREHARLAMKLAPDRYQKQGEQLIRKVTVHHFGCLGVYFAESEPSAAK